jgi:SAM-dependent methyltransferase
MYNSHEYWNTRPEPNGHNNITTLDEQFIPNFLEGSKTVLDFGCGIGRTFKLYKGYDVTGVDFSTIYRDRAIKSANDSNVNFEHIVHDVHKSTLPFKDDCFDKGLMISVLLHANETELVTILTEVGRVCKEVFIISLFNPNTITDGVMTTQKNQASHVFNHNYKMIIENLGFKITSYDEINGQVILTYTK